MERILLFLAIAGLSNCLQYPLHYKYRTYGSVTTGIPEVKNQAAGWAVKIDVSVYVEKDDGLAIFKFENFKMADFHGKNLGCDFRGDLNDDAFQSMADENFKYAIESPFRVDLFGQEDFAIEDLDDKIKWATNTRKAVASIFRNEFLKGNIGNQIEGSVAAAFHAGNVLNVFSVKEETVFGICSVAYTVHPVPEHIYGTKNRYLESLKEQDVQRGGDSSASAYTSKTSKKTTSKKYVSGTSKKSPKKTSKTASKYTRSENVPELKDDLWHVVRSVNFDDCEEIVALQVTSLEAGKTSGGQHQWRRSRSSVSEYIFRGSPGNVRLERAVVEGATTVMPFGYETEALQARINQTYELISVTSGDTVPALQPNTKVSKTWMQEVWSFAKAPAVSKPHPWVVYTGKGSEVRHYQTFGMDPFTAEEIDDAKSLIVDNIEKASLYLTDVDQESEEQGIVKLLHVASQIFKHLSKEEILKLFDYFYKKDLHQHDVLGRKLVVDAAAASGSYYAYDAILDYIKQDKIPDLQIMTIFMGISGNAECPSNIPSYVDWILSSNLKKKPFVMSTVMVNVASLMRKMCVSPHARDTYFGGPVFGDGGCDLDAVNNRFIPFLKDLLYSEETTWEKRLALTTLEILRTPLSYDILVPIIEGQVKCSTRLRAYAAYSLSGWALSEFPHLRKPIMDLFTDVFSNIGEKVEVRETALLSLVSWLPEPHFWHRLARTSWREPSKAFASYITSIITMFARFEVPETILQNQAATFALKFARPAAPSMTSSHIETMSSHMSKNRVSKFLSVSWQTSKNIYKLTENEIFYMANIGGLNLNVLEFYIMREGGTYKILQDFIKHEMDSKSESAGGITARIAQDFYSRVQDTIKAEKMKDGEAFSMDVVISLLDNVNLFLPISKETIESSAFFNANDLASLVLQLAMGHDFVLGKFFNPVDMKSFQPTELGLPLFITTSSPIVMTDSSYTTLTLGGGKPSLDSIKKMEVTSEGLMRFYSEYNTGIWVLLPWSKKLVGTNVVSGRDITLPYNLFSRNGETTIGDGKLDVNLLQVRPLYKKKFSPLSAFNAPYTGFNPVIPLKNPPEPMHVDLIMHSGVTDVEFHLPGRYTGFDVDFIWTSEMAFPLRAWNIDDFLGDTETHKSPWFMYALTSPTAKFWAAKIDFNPETSKTKNISIEYMRGTFGKAEELTQVTGDSFYQYGQNTDEQFDQKQSFDFEQEGFQEIGKSDEVETASRINYGDTLDQRSQKMQEHLGGAVQSHIFKVSFDGDREHRNFELLYSYTKSHTSETRELKKSQISLLRSPIPDVDPNSASVCFDFQISRPVISLLDTAVTLLEENLDKQVKAEMTLGCTGKPVISAKGSYHLTDDWKNKYQKELPSACDFDPHNPLFALKSNALYDEINYTIEWQKVCDFKNYPVTSKIFGHARKLLDLVTSARCDQPETERKIGVKINRCPYSGNWHMDFKHGDSETKFKSIPNDFIFSSLFAIRNHDRQDHSDHNTIINLESESCVIAVDSVRTFDGFTYSYEPTQCWSVAYKDCSVENGRMILVRSPAGESSLPNFKYIDVRKGLVIEYVNNDMKVNGMSVDPIGGHETVKDKNGEVLVTVYKKKDYYMVEFEEDFSITAKTEKIRIQLPFHLWGTACGLCGNNDGEPEAEMVGPHGCFYNDPNMFVASWTAGGDTCDLYKLLELREAAEEFQKSCKTYESMRQQCPSVYHQGMKIVYPISHLGNATSCISSTPSVHCENGHESSFITERELFNCWPNYNAPEELKKALDAGYDSVRLPFSYEPHFQDYIEVTSAKVCKNY